MRKDINVKKEYDYIIENMESGIKAEISPLEMILNNKFMSCGTKEETHKLKNSYIEYLEILEEENLLRLIDEE